MAKVLSDIKKIMQTVFVLSGIYRKDDGLIAGVCKGIADRFNWNVTLIRIIWLISPFITLGSSIIIYLLMVIIIPKAQKVDVKFKNKNNKDDYIDVKSKEL